jgi:predicted nucleic acid-binding protein
MTAGVAPSIFVFDSSPLVASCQFAVRKHAVAEIALAGADVHTPPAVDTEVVTQGGSRPEACIAARLITAGYVRVIDAAVVAEALEDLQHYQLAHGEQEALTLTARLRDSVVMVTDDFLALIVANRLGLSCQLFLDFVVGRATRGELPVATPDTSSRRSALATPRDSSRTRSIC